MTDKGTVVLGVDPLGPEIAGAHGEVTANNAMRHLRSIYNFIAATQSVFIVLLLTMVLYVSFFDVRRWTRDVQSDRADAQAKETAAEQQKKAAEPAKP